MRIIHWNISYNCQKEKVAGFIREQISDGDTIVCLQEVTESSFESIRGNLGCDCDYVYSLNHRRPGKHDGKNRHLGVMIICPKPMCIVDYGVVDRAIFPDRTAYADIQYFGEKYRILSLHSITGCAYGKAKSTQFYAFAEAIEAFRPDIVTFDANEPAKDHYDIAQMEFFDNGDKGDGAKTFFSSLASSGLSDAFAIHYDKANFIDGEPLATSHIIHGKIRRRYDFTFVNTSRLPVSSCEYLYDKGCELTSDHAIIITDVKLKTRVRTPDKGINKNCMYPYRPITKESLLKFCRYYKGDEASSSSLLGGYERRWVESMLSERERIMDIADEYDLRWLETFNAGDGVPLSLKATLFNRYFHWSDYSTIDNFKHWYLECYLKGKDEEER